MKLKFNMTIDIDFSKKQLSKLELYYEERVPELAVFDSNGFNEEFVEVLRQKYMYEIEEDILNIVN